MRTVVKILKDVGLLKHVYRMGPECYCPPELLISRKGTQCRGGVRNR